MILALTLILSVTACSPKQDASSGKSSGEIKVTDAIGREVTLAAPATKVVGTHNPSLNTAVVIWRRQVHCRLWQQGHGPRPV